uniref:RNMT-activating mini protein n=1 Tax=Scophthalmus maximus TaxID=52904 RepID=A0A8D3ASI7_SCOMX
MAESTETLQKYEELFAHRFSSEDQEYQQYLNRPADPPPIVEDWRGNQRGRDNRCYHEGWSYEHKS